MEDFYYLVSDCVSEITKLCHITYAIELSATHIQHKIYYYAITNLTLGFESQYISKYYNIKYCHNPDVYDLSLMLHLTEMKFLNCTNAINLNYLPYFPQLHSIINYSFSIKNLISFSCLVNLYIDERKMDFDLALLQKLTYLAFRKSTINFMQSKAKSPLNIKFFRGSMCAIENIDCVQSLTLNCMDNISYIDSVRYKNLKHISIDKTLSKLWYLMPRTDLTQLYSLECKIESEDELISFIRYLKELKSLNITAFQSVHIAEMKKIPLLINNIECVKHLRNLEHLTCFNVEAKTLNQLFHLKTLNVNKIEDQNEVYLSTDMEELKIMHHDVYVDLKLDKLTRLTCLELNLNNSNGREEFDALQRVNLTNLKNLKILRVSFYVDITGWYNLMPRLKVLQAKNIIDDECGHGLEKMTNLRSIYYHESNVTTLNLYNMKKVRYFKGKIRKGTVIMPSYVRSSI